MPLVEWGAGACPLALLLCLLCLVPSAQPAARPELAFVEHCGGAEWMEEYGKLHNTSVAQTRNTLTLDFRERGCGGLGNFFYMAYRWFVVAYVSQRAFVMRIPERCDVGPFLRSEYFDWNATTPDGVLVIKTVMYVIGKKGVQRLNQQFRTLPPDELFSPKGVAIVAGTLDPAPGQILSNPHTLKLQEASPLFQLSPTARHACVHHLLFTPSPEVQSAVSEYLQRLGTTGAGVHIRLGDTLSGLVPLRGKHFDRRPLPQWRCSEKAVGNGLVYVAADSPDQVPLWRERFGNDTVLSHIGAPRHTAHSVDFDSDALLKVLIDFRVVCAAPRRFLTTSSSFSTEAHYCAFGNNSWTINDPNCSPFIAPLD